MCKTESVNEPELKLTLWWGCVRTTDLLKHTAKLTVFEKLQRNGDIISAFKSGVFNPRAACGPRASFTLPGKGISQNTMRYEY